MQDAGYGLPRTPLLGTLGNKGKKKGGAATPRPHLMSYQCALRTRPEHSLPTGWQVSSPSWIQHCWSLGQLIGSLPRPRQQKRKSELMHRSPHNLNGGPPQIDPTASASFGVKASAPPRRAAPSHLSTSRRDTLPLARPRASASKERSLASSVILPLHCLRVIKQAEASGLRKGSRPGRVAVPLVVSEGVDELALAHLGASLDADLFGTLLEVLL